MLVLTRKPEEKIIIGKKGKRIVITILKVVGEKVSVGIEADKDEYPVFRDELLVSPRGERSSGFALEMKEETAAPAKELAAPFAIPLKEKHPSKVILAKEPSFINREKP